MGKYKLIHFFAEDKQEMYDLEEDLSEEKNLASIHPDICKEMYCRLNDWIAEIDALIPTKNPDYTGDTKPNGYRHYKKISEFDLETPLGILLHDLKAKGILDENIDYANKSNLWAINGSIDHTIQQMEHIFGDKTQEIMRRLAELK